MYAARPAAAVTPGHTRRMSPGKPSGTWNPMCAGLGEVEGLAVAATGDSTYAASDNGGDELPDAKGLTSAE